MKKIFLLLIFIFLLTGCNSYTELNDLSIVNTLGIDYQDNKYNLVLSTIERDKDNDSINVYSSNKKSLNRALNDIYLTSNKKLYLSHIDLLILTPDSINNKLNEILNNFLKDNQYRNNFQVIIMNSDDLNTFFNKKIVSEEVTNLIDINSKETGIIYKKELEEFLNDILIDNNSVLPTITFNDDILTLSSYTLIKDKKTDKVLSTDDSIILNLLNKKTERTCINDINIYHSDIRIKTNKNKISFEIYLTTDTDDKYNIKRLKRKILSFLEAYENKDIDILKLSELIKKNDYSYYKNNKDLLSKLEFKIKIVNKKQNNYINGGLDEE